MKKPGTRPGPRAPGPIKQNLSNVYNKKISYIDNEVEGNFMCEDQLNILDSVQCPTFFVQQLFCNQKKKLLILGFESTELRRW